MSTRAERFAAYDLANPQVWVLFERFTLEVIQAGHERYSADAVMHRVRWHTSVETTGPTFKVNNDHVALYARKFMATYPAHRGFFRTRRSPG